MFKFPTKEFLHRIVIECGQVIQSDGDACRDLSLVESEVNQVLETMGMDELRGFISAMILPLQIVESELKQSAIRNKDAREIKGEAAKLISGFAVLRTSLNIACRLAAIRFLRLMGEEEKASPEVANAQ